MNCADAPLDHPSSLAVVLEQRASRRRRRQTRTRCRGRPAAKPAEEVSSGPRLSRLSRLIWRSRLGRMISAQSSTSRATPSFATGRRCSPASRLHRFRTTAALGGAVAHADGDVRRHMGGRGGAVRRRPAAPRPRWRRVGIGEQAAIRSGSLTWQAAPGQQAGDQMVCRNPWMRLIQRRSRGSVRLSGSDASAAMA
jgi:hypothetical protein